MRINKAGRPRENDDARKRFQAVVAPSTLEWFEGKNKPPGRVLDDLVEKEKIKEDYNSRG